MGCNAECRCRKGVVALVFVPGIMGSRLMNVESGDTIWDPAAGWFFDGPSAAAVELKAQRQKELAAVQADDDDGVWEATGKWFGRRWLEIKQLSSAPHDMASELARRTRTKALAVTTVSHLIFAGPVKRKALLVNELTERKGKPITERNDGLLDVDSGDDRYFRLFTSVPKFQVQQKRRRGWGEVLWDSYGPFLRYLESQSPELKRRFPGLQFPVFAIGYNWMLSNQKAGERIKAKLAEFKKQILEEDRLGDDVGLTEADIKFVMITHSMGGFASRSAFMLSGLEDEVEGVIHGAMPTHGSPDTYYRMRSGAGGSGMLGQVFRQVLGKNAADMTAILGYCQGGLELLPNQLYVDAHNQPQWLFVNTAPDQPEQRQALEIGYGDGIFDFYRNFDPWYRMVQPPLLAPELGSGGELGNHIKSFVKRIDDCESFHTQLAAQFHCTTALIYSHNPDTPAFDHCEWQAQGPLTPGLADCDVNTWQQIGDENHDWWFVKGAVSLTSRGERATHQRAMTQWRERALYRPNPLPPPPLVTTAFQMAQPSAPGDGTVHQGAGQYPQGMEVIGLNASQDHQNFFNCPEVRQQVMGVVQWWLPDIFRNLKKAS